ncbi:MAG: chorismate mutase [Patescibacteria group bacterium]|jgi:chorismate mutase/prephenate dehydrogenase
MNLEELRTEIDKIDGEIIGFLAKRFEIVGKIGQIKNEQGLPAYQPEREKMVLESLKGKARRLEIEDKFIDDLYEIIFAESRKIQSGKN